MFVLPGPDSREAASPCFYVFLLGSADGMGRRLHSAPGLDLSKPLTAEMEHVLYEPSTVPVSQVSASRAKVLDARGVL
jgi:hypothetical protein